MAGIWSLLAVPVFVIELIIVGMGPDFSLGKVGGIFWAISAVAMIYGLMNGSLILMLGSITIVYLRGSGRLGN